MGRFARAEEIAQGALFLASDESSFVTASTFLVDGGLSGAYTPQVVVDGERDVLGSDRAALLAAVAELAARPKGEVRLRLGQAPGTVAVEAAWPEVMTGDLFLALVEAEAVSNVARVLNEQVPNGVQ